MISVLLVLALAAPGGVHAAEKRSRSEKPVPKKMQAPAELPAAPKKEAPKMEWKGQYGGAPEAGHRLITDQKGWDALWRVLGKDAPALDLKAYNAVAVFIGEKPTGGWTATFDEPREKDGDTLLTYRVNAPKGFVTQAFTQPYLVKAFPKPAKGKMLVLEATPE